MGDFIGRCAIVMVVLSPLLRRFYIERFWIKARGIVIRLEGGLIYHRQRLCSGVGG